MVKKAELSSDDDIGAQLGATGILSVKEYISTGSTLLDYAIANRKNGGIPVGRITELCGNEGSGKSLLALRILAETQRRDGIAVYIDTERAADEEFMRRMGLDIDRLIYPKAPNSIEGVFQYLENTVKVVRQKFPNKEKKVTVVWDSVAATKAKELVEVEYGEGRIGPEARAMSDCFKRAMDLFDLGYVTLVCTNQLRTKIGGYSPDTTPHGKALGFYSSCRIKLKSIKKLSEGKPPQERIVGVRTKAEVFKNRMAPPYRDVEFPIMFDWGVDDESSWIDFLKEFDVVTTSGAWSTLNIDQGYKFQGTDGFSKVLKEAGVRDKVLNIIDDKMVIKYDQKPDVSKLKVDSIAAGEEL